jgi:hypothetical protein
LKGTQGGSARNIGLNASSIINLKTNRIGATIVIKGCGIIESQRHPNSGKGGVNNAQTSRRLTIVPNAVRTGLVEGNRIDNRLGGRDGNIVDDTNRSIANRDHTGWTRFLNDLSLSA